jgi:predicted metal-dependent hydrolase
MKSHDGIRVRVSDRARRMRLSAAAPDRIEMVVPRNTSEAKITAFAGQHADWIERARAELARRYRGDASAVPVTIEFPAVGCRWRLAECEAGLALEPVFAGTAILDFEPLTRALAGRAVLPLPQGDPKDELHVELRRWLMVQARGVLPGRVAVESQRLRLVPAKVQVRLQRSRWGSCSARKTVSLNARSLFLGPDLLRYLIVHELCHLAHLAHSPAFWSLVAQYEPDYRRLDAQLKTAWTEVPRWAYPP